ncbi:MAG: hypothetical protein GTO22_02835 [Gemmatimonadales bacterium]|nr:hypothetical protein [Gemmatimonadales bacterium]
MVPGGSTAAGAPVDSGGASWLRPIASALMPGAGQFISGHDRGAIYLVVEALLVTRFIIFHNEGRRERDRFRELAFTVARAPFTPTVRDTVFEYFEQLGKFIESGGFDTDTGPNLVPPTDERTFNGSIWALAQRIFFADPDNPPDPDSEEFRRALKFYEQRAVGPNFQWSWRNAGLEQDLFRRSIRQSDEAFRRATQQLGLLLANHLLSALDAFISQRLSQNNRQVALASALWHPGEGRGLQWVMMVQVGF